MDSNPKDPHDEKVIGKLCVLEYEMPVTEKLLKDLGKSGSDGLDELFAYSVPYSTTLLTSINAFFQQQVDFPIVVDQILGTFYKHRPKWSELFDILKKDSGAVTLYVCPVTGVPKVIGSDELFEIHVNGLTVRMTGTGLSKLSRVTHQPVSKDDAESALEYIDSIGFIGALIENMSEFAENLFTVITANRDEDFVDFFQDLLLAKQTAINMNTKTGKIEIIHSDTEYGETLFESEEETLQEILESAPEQNSPEHEHLGIEDEIAAIESEESDTAEFGFSREDLKNANSVFIEGNKTKH